MGRRFWVRVREVRLEREEEGKTLRKREEELSKLKSKCGWRWRDLYNERRADGLNPSWRGEVGKDDHVPEFTRIKHPLQGFLPSPMNVLDLSVPEVLEIKRPWFRPHLQRQQRSAGLCGSYRRTFIVSDIR